MSIPQQRPVLKRPNALQEKTMPIKAASTGDVPAVDAPTGDVPAVDASTGDVPAVDASTGDVPVVDAPTGDVPAVDAPTGDVPAVDAPIGDVPAVDAPVGDVPAEVRVRAWEREGVKAYTSLSVPNRKSNSDGSSCLSIINSSTNGRRLEFPKSIISKLGNPTGLQILKADSELCVSAKLPNGGKTYALREQKSRMIIYASNLVKELTEDIGLDFTNGKVCHSFYEYTIDTEGFEGNPVLIINVEQ